MWTRQKGDESLREQPGVREFSGTTMRDILADVREAFGRDAIILTQQTFHGRIHVLATSDDNQGVLADRRYPPEDTLMGPVPEAGIAGLFSASRTRKQARAMIPRTGPAEANRLKALGFDSRLLELAARGNASRALAEKALALAVGDDRDYTGSGIDAPEAGAYRFIGPTGHGRTTLIGKLATAWVLEHGAKNLVLASTDRQRFGATLLLERMAELIGVPFHVVDDGELAALVAGKASLLLIDTDGGMTEGRRIDAIDGVIDVLVVSATAEPEMLARAVHGAPRDAEIALTQLDLTAAPGRALSILWNERPLGRVLDWISYGQSIDASHAPACVGSLSSFVEPVPSTL